MALNKIKYAYSCPRQRLNSITPPRARDLLSAAYENRGQKITTRWMIRGAAINFNINGPAPFGAVWHNDAGIRRRSIFHPGIAARISLFRWESPSQNFTAGIDQSGRLSVGALANNH